MDQVEQHKAKILDKRDKIGLVRDLALLLKMDADLVADIQAHFNVQDMKLNKLREDVA